MIIRDRLQARKRRRRSQWSQRVLKNVVDTIESAQDIELISAAVEADPGYVRIVCRAGGRPRPLGLRGYVPAPDRGSSAVAQAQQLSELVMAEPWERLDEVLVPDDGIDWWGAGYPRFGLSLGGALGPEDADDDEAWARWRGQRLVPLTSTAPAGWLGTSKYRVQSGYPARARLFGFGNPDDQFGDLPTTVLQNVCAVLARHTDTAADAICAVSGYSCWITDTAGSFTSYVFAGQSAPPPTKQALPSLIRHGHRTHIDHYGVGYVLFSGPVAAMTDMGYYRTPRTFLRMWPNMLWPKDHAWFAECGIDDEFMDVAGPRSLIDELSSIKGVRLDRVG